MEATAKPSHHTDKLKVGSACPSRAHAPRREGRSWLPLSRAAAVCMCCVRAHTQELRCSENTVLLWLTRWQETRSLEDGERSGRPRCTTDDTDQEIEALADENNSKRTVPKEIKKEMQLECSARTVPSVAASMKSESLDE